MRRRPRKLTTKVDEGGRVRREGEKEARLRVSTVGCDVSRHFHFE